VDSPSRHIANVFDQMLFADRHLAHDIIGRKESIRSFKKQDFEDFLQKYYGLENLLLVIAGNIKKLAKDEKELLAIIEKNFSKLTQKRAKGKQEQPIYQDWSKLTAKELLEAAEINQKAFSTEKFKLVKRKTEQAHFVMAWPAYDARHKDRYVLSLLSAILGGNMSSRLFTQVREERGLAYYVRSEMDLMHDAGLLGCSAGVDPSRVEEAIKISRQVFENLASGKEPVTAAELERAKKYLKGKMLLSLESSTSVAQFFGFKELLLDDLMQVDEALALLEAVSLKDIARVAKEVLVTDELRFAMIGNFTDEGKIKALLN
jgi:predicted Zn-dependent peptidase